MHKRNIIVLIACITLTACEGGKEAIGTIKDYGKTASGTVHEAKDQFNAALNTGKSMTDGVMEMIEDAKKRMNQVQDGMNMMMEGKEMIEEGVAGENEQN